MTTRNGHKPRVVAIAGKAPSTAGMVNEEDPNVEVWGLADAYVHLKRPAQRWFEIHTPDSDGLYVGWNSWAELGPEKHLAWLTTCGIPVYTQEKDPRIVTSVPFPFHEIGMRFRPYWSGSIPYMLSLAAYEEVDEVHLWGVDMAGGSEYEDQRPCAEYWIGVLDTQGCKVFVPDASPVLKAAHGTYGITTRKPITAAAIRDELSRFDQATVHNGITDESRGGRKALVTLLERADPAARGKPVEPYLTITNPDEEQAKRTAAAVRKAILAKD
jgi:hypothetical protein